MNIIEEEAKEFYKDDFLNRGEYISLESLKSILTTKLYNFNKDRDRLDFLKILRIKTYQDKEEHMKTCSGCDYDKNSSIGLFVIDQEIDSINEYYNFEPKKADSFTIEEESIIHSKLNDILEKLTKLDKLDNLEKQDYGQEIIFNEIEELKNHFNIGKKNWFQLLKGKLIDLTLTKVLNETIVKEIYNTLSEGFDQAIKMIN